MREIFCTRGQFNAALLGRTTVESLINAAYYLRRNVDCNGPLYLTALNAADDLKEEHQRQEINLPEAVQFRQEIFDALYQSFDDYMMDYSRAVRATGRKGTIAGEERASVYGSWLRKLWPVEAHVQWACKH